MLIADNHKTKCKRMTLPQQHTELISKAVATDKWDNAALTELNNLINDIENGKRIYKRFSYGSAQTFRNRDSRATKASIILRESTDASSTTQRLTKLRRRLRDEAVSPTQEGRCYEFYVKAKFRPALICVPAYVNLFFHTRHVPILLPFRQKVQLSQGKTRSHDIASTKTIATQFR